MVQVNGTERTADDALCLVRPQIADPALHKLLKDLLTRKRFKVTELAPGTSPNVCVSLGRGTVLRPGSC